MIWDAIVLIMTSVLWDKFTHDDVDYVSEQITNFQKVM